MPKKEKSIDQLPEVENGGAINELIKEINEIISSWTDLYSPITEWRKKTLESCSMEGKTGASIKDALLGLIVTMVSDLNMTIEDLKKVISFKTEAPFIDIKTVDKYMAVYEAIKEWVMAFVGVKDRCDEFIEKL